MAETARAWVEQQLATLCAHITADGYQPKVHRELSMWGSVYIEVARPCRNGLTFARTGVWLRVSDHKPRKQAFGTGYVLRCAGEPFLIGTIGNPRTARNVRSVIEGPIREHSRKPEEAYAEAEKLMPRARRADLFSRQTRPGWTSWGNEAGKFDGLEGGQ
jgi:N6-adenosine-specific RNA methylase IME4